MSEVVGEPDPSGTTKSGSANAAWALGLVALAASLVFYLRLFGRIGGRSEAMVFFLKVLLPIAAAHTVILLLLYWRPRLRVRGPLLFWGLSGAAVLAFGGWARAGAFVLAVLFAIVIGCVGDRLARLIFVDESRGWGLSLALGILFLSVSGSVLAAVQLFKWWVLALLIVAVIASGRRSGGLPVLARLKTVWSALRGPTSLAHLFLLQGFFLVGAYAFVVATAPETHSDAVRFYLPYMKLMRHYSGLFDMPWQWSYIVPQAGVTYGAAMLSLLGKQAARLPMLLAWAALIGMSCRGFRTADVAPGRQAAILVVASCPGVLWVASSVMQDTFVCLTVVVLAILCLAGARPGSLWFWAAIGICLGVAWAAKYSTLAYAAPLLLAAAFRTVRESGWVKMLRGAVFASMAALLTATPWLLHAYRECGNPVFPFFPRIFPAPLWPRGVGFSNLDTFRFSPGWRGWLQAPFDMTFHTRRFVEGPDGLAGLALLAILPLAALAMWKGRPAVRALAICSFAGTALLWSQTAYLRYWLPGLWLAALAAGSLLERIVPRTTLARIMVVLAAFGVLIPQVLMAAMNFWQDPKGLPLDFYRGKISWQEFLDRQYRGFAQIERSETFGHNWPRIWFTGFEGAGHLQVQPMEATVWELSLHANEPRTKIEYLCAAGSKYWIVDEDGDDAYWVKAIGISQFFWNAENFVERFGSLAVYRMPASATALREFDARSAPGTDLLVDGGFEIGRKGKLTFWRSEGEAAWICPSPIALRGQGILRLSSLGKIRQDVALPRGVSAVEFSASTRTCSGCSPVPLRCRVTVSGFLRDPVPGRPEDWIEPYQLLSGQKMEFDAQEDWLARAVVVTLPPRAKYVTIEIEKVGGVGEAFVDEVRLLSR